jgi:hypothetical protein
MNCAVLVSWALAGTGLNEKDGAAEARGTDKMKTANRMRRDRTGTMLRDRLVTDSVAQFHPYLHVSLESTCPKPALLTLHEKRRSRVKVRVS